jgi:hypothetical protein
MDAAAAKARPRRLLMSAAGLNTSQTARFVVFLTLAICFYWFKIAQGSRESAVFL